MLSECNRKSKLKGKIQTGLLYALRGHALHGFPETRKSCDPAESMAHEGDAARPRPEMDTIARLRSVRTEARGRDSEPAAEQVCHRRRVPVVGRDLVPAAVRVCRRLPKQNYHRVLR